ncbi:hypothetical protein B0H14DRAFT_3608230 [Mycena olivaceomarginata]|nr:hypothetical protein B0H14DRAFT_3608230 [Mycena olivaceomarginata]
MLYVTRGAVLCFCSLTHLDPFASPAQPSAGSSPTSSPCRTTPPPRVTRPCAHNLAPIAPQDLLSTGEMRRCGGLRRAVLALASIRLCPPTCAPAPRAGSTLTPTRTALARPPLLLKCLPHQLRLPLSFPWPTTTCPNTSTSMCPLPACPQQHTHPNSAFARLADGVHQCAPECRSPRRGQEQMRVVQVEHEARHRESRQPSAHSGRHAFPLRPLPNPSSHRSPLPLALGTFSMILHLQSTERPRRSPHKHDSNTS